MDELHRHRNRCLQNQRFCPQPLLEKCHRAGSGSMNGPVGFLQRKTDRRGASTRLLNHGGLNAGNPFLRFGCHGLVTADQQNRRAKRTANRTVQPGFTCQPPVQPQVGNPLGGPGVVEDARHGTGAGMIANEKDRVHPGLDAFHHAKRGRVTGIEPRLRVQFLQQDVGAVPMPVSNHKFIHPGGACPGDGSIHIRCHDAAKAGIFGMGGVDVIGMDHPGDAFHVGSDQEVHMRLLVGCVVGCVNYTPFRAGRSPGIWLEKIHLAFFFTL